MAKMKMSNTVKQLEFSHIANGKQNATATLESSLIVFK